MCSFASTLQCIVVLIIILGSLEAFTFNNGNIVGNKTNRNTSNLSAIANPLKRRSRTNIIHVESVQEYKEQVVNEKECISVVRFYSQYCKSCQASEPHFYKLASEFGNKDTSGIKVNFVEVPLNKNTSILHEALEVPSLPWTHIYHPDAGLVEERAVSKKYINDVRKCLRCYVYGECDMDDAPWDCKEVYGECAIE